MAYFSESRSCGCESTLCVMGILCFFWAFDSVAAHEYTVGGRNGWTVIPNDTKSESYNQWAERNIFHVGDTLLFVYKPKEDSVLQVTQESYRSCNTTNPIASLIKDGNTAFKFNSSGPFYFISGVRGHCEKSEKLHVTVLAIRGQAPVPAVVNDAPAPTPANAFSIGEGKPFYLKMAPGFSIAALPPNYNAAPHAFMQFSTPLGFMGMVGTCIVILLL
eukprot:Gb_09362 [translate_table: standard]